MPSIEMKTPPVCLFRYLFLYQEVSDGLRTPLVTEYLLLSDPFVVSTSLAALQRD